MESSRLPPKYIGETITVRFYFGDVMRLSDDAYRLAAQVKLFAGEDATPEDMISGDASWNSATKVFSQQFTGGVAGNIYKLCAVIETDLGMVLRKETFLAVLPGDDDLVPAFISEGLDLRAFTITGNMPDGATGDIVSYSYTVRGGIEPITYDVVPGGDVPTGTDLAVHECVVSGTLLTGGTYPFTVRGTDALGQVATCDDVVVVANTLFIAGAAPDLYLGETLNYDYTTGNGTPPLVCSNSSGSLPDGGSINSAGHLGGVTTAAGVFTFGPRVTDAGLNTATISDTVEVWESMVVHLGKADDDVVKSYSFAGGNLVEVDSLTTPGTGLVGYAIVPESNKVYITCRDSDQVICMNRLTYAITATITVGNGPRGLAADAEFVYVCNYSASTVSKIRVSSNTVVATLATADKPTHCALDPDGTYLWVTAQNRILQIATAGMTLVDTIIQATVWGIAITPDGDDLFVGRTSHSHILHYDVATLTETVIELDGIPRGLSIDPTGTYLTCGITNSAYGLQKVTIATLDADPVVDLGAGADTHSVCTDRTGTYILAQAGSNLYLVNPSTYAVIDTLASNRTGEYCAGRVLP